MKQKVTSSERGNANELSENEAVCLAQQGDAAGFERLYQLNSRRVYALCLHLVKNPTEAEDLTQDVFLQTFRKIQSFQGDSRFSTWLHRITLNIVLIRLHKRKPSEISRIEMLEPNDESRETCAEISGPDLNLTGVIDRINLENAIGQSSHGYKKRLILQIQGYQHS
jgi:RNA polymerase sigma-70 factor (ECF subfamily)